MGSDPSRDTNDVAFHHVATGGLTLFPSRCAKPGDARRGIRPFETFGHFFCSSYDCLLLIQQIPAAKSAKGYKVVLPDLAQRTSIGTLPESRIDPLID